MNKRRFDKLAFITTNPFSIFCLVVGIILGVLNGFPNTYLTIFAGFLEGGIFYIIAVLISSAFYYEEKEEKGR